VEKEGTGVMGLGPYRKAATAATVATDWEALLKMAGHLQL
jgi:hypothetical protein